MLEERHAPPQSNTTINHALFVAATARPLISLPFLILSDSLFRSLSLPSEQIPLCYHPSSVRLSPPSSAFRPMNGVPQHRAVILSARLLNRYFRKLWMVFIVSGFAL